MNSEIHIFIVWSKAKYKLNDILNDINKNLTVKKLYEINWSKNKFSENLSRFYGQNLPDGSGKEEHCGKDIFTCIVVEDKHPKYDKRKTSRGIETVNINMFDLKLKYREWTGGGHKIHATNNIEESKHDIALLFDKDIEDFKNIDYDNSIINYNNDLTGANGWSNIEHLFKYLNNFTNYIVMRNFECLPNNYTLEEHGDIDLLVENLEEIVYLTNAKKVFLEENRVHYKIKIGDEDVLFDFRFLGDNYYNLEFEKMLLLERIFYNGFYRPKDELYFSSLLYHALVHKPSFAIDYKNRLDALGSKINIDTTLLHINPTLLLIDEIDKYNMYIVEPYDKSVYYNKQVVNMVELYNDLYDKCDKDIDKVLFKDNRWKILYNLSPIRKNIISWYPFKKDSNCLEIGARCGIVTNALCEYVDQVVAVELSYRKAKIISKLNKKYNNLNIKVGNISNLKINEKFDYITLIGVLEYAGTFIKTKEPYKDFLKYLKSYLKPDGKLIVAIENRYGMKYFAGAKEEHTGIEFDGINGYKNTNKVKTFGKVEIENLLKESGYPKQEFYYPYPDYKMPLEIFSDEYLPDNYKKFIQSPNYDYDRNLIFDETEAYRGIIENNQYKFFANSFLIICGE